MVIANKKKYDTYQEFLAGNALPEYKKKVAELDGVKTLNAELLAALIELEEWCCRLGMRKDMPKATDHLLIHVLPRVRAAVAKAKELGL